MIVNIYNFRGLMNFNTKGFFLIALIFIQVNIWGQDYTVNVFPSRLNISFETVEVDDEPDLGFLGTGFEILNINRKLSSLYFGLHAYSAITGNRPGLITLGMNAGLKIPILKKQSIFADAGFFIGGGGGGGAADGGGLILRPHINLEKQFGVFGVKVGYSQINFPTGEINGNQFNVGFTLNGVSFLKGDETNGALSTFSPRFKKLNFSITNTYYFGLTEDSIEDNTDVDRTIGLVGAQLEYSFTDNFYGIGKINGALSGGVDGYLAILLGVGGSYPVIDNVLNIESRVLFGPTGGGRVDSGGGATAQYEIGASLFLKNDFYIKGFLGKTQSPWGNLDANHFEISLGKSFGRIDSKNGENQTVFKVHEKELIENHISVSVYNRTYFVPDGLDKNNIPYLDSFNLLTFEGQKYIGDKFTLNATTVWAYTGDYGAYAEGLLGVGYHQPIFPKWNINAKALFGAAGGGGLDVGSGLIFQYSAGIERKIGKRNNFFVSFGRYTPLEGNFKPYSLDVGFVIDLFQLFKK